MKITKIHILLCLLGVTSLLSAQEVVSKQSIAVDPNGAQLNSFFENLPLRAYRIQPLRARFAAASCDSDHPCFPQKTFEEFSGNCVNNDDQAACIASGGLWNAVNNPGGSYGDGAYYHICGPTLCCYTEKYCNYCAGQSHSGPYSVSTPEPDEGPTCTEWDNSACVNHFATIHHYNCDDTTDYIEYHVSTGSDCTQICTDEFTRECALNGWSTTISGCDCICSNSPIVIDTNGGGFKFLPPTPGVNFDLGGTGHATPLSWPSPDSGNAFLALDRNNNGTIDNGTELFGNVTPQSPGDTPNGFRALADFDKPENGGNGDGVIDSRDAVYEKLRLWIDKNGNGVSETEEMFTLPQMGITSISLDYHLSERTDQFGNRFKYRATVQSTAKTSRWAYDVILATPTSTRSATK